MKREAIATMVMEHRLSECRACTLVGLCGDVYRNSTLRSEHNTAPKHQITEIVRTHRRAGYRVIHDVLRAEYAGINHKRIYQLYS